MKRIQDHPKEFEKARQTNLSDAQRRRVALELERLFPWLGTDEDAGSGAETQHILALYHETLLLRSLPDEA